MTEFYGVFDAEGRATAFYNTDIFPPQEDGSLNAGIPAEAVEITEEQWQELLANPQARYDDGKSEVIYANPPIGTSQYEWGPTFVETIGQY